MLPKKSWQNRPFEIRNLLNPYFCTTLIWESVDGFCEEKKDGMSFSLAFLVLPFILHNDIREKLPDRKNTNTKLNWVEKISKETFIRIPTYCHNFAPYTRESIILGTQQQLLFVNDKGLLQSSNTLSKQEELTEYRNKARVLGKLFTPISPEVIFRTLELTP